jgi:hypothetical protein
MRKSVGIQPTLLGGRCCLTGAHHSGIDDGEPEDVEKDADARGDQNLCCDAQHT